jgi:tetratricopeptide (TPR) repeat protein
MPLRITSSKKGILWQGAFFANHSLALVNRELTLALLETGQFEIGLEHYSTPELSADLDQRWSALSARLHVKPESPFVTIRHFYPPEFRRPDTDRLVLIQPWEFGSLPMEWVQGIERGVDEVWVPTQFVRETYIQSGVCPERVRVVPNGVNTDRFHPQVSPMTLPTKKGFKFLFVGGTIYRKGIDILLKSYTDAFTASDDVTLIIKDFGVGSFYRGQDAGKLISEIQSRKNAPEIIYLTEDLSEAEMASLYASADCLVHPYRGEGYGLPIAEAMACGKPTIITNFGAALDYANANNSFLIPAKIARFDRKRLDHFDTVDYPYLAEPDSTALTEILRFVAGNPQAAARIGSQAAADIREKHTWRHAAQIAAQALLALSDKQGRHNERDSSATVVSPLLLAGKKQAAMDRMYAGKWREAAQLLEECIAADRADWPLLNAQAVALYNLGERERAQHILQQAVKDFPRAVAFHQNLVQIYLESGDCAAAVQHLLSLHPADLQTKEMRSLLERVREACVKSMRQIRKAHETPKKKSQSRSGGKRAPMLLKENRRYQQLLSGIQAIDALLDEQKRGAHTNKRPSSQPTISLVMIVKNEERFLEGCLESVRDCVDEIIIVDTGSTDRTLEIAQKFGAKLFHFAWCDDFSAARNYSLDHATGDWALWLDADERLTAESGRAMRSLISNTPDTIGGYMVSIKNFMRKDELADVSWHRACRLFRNRPNIRFTGRVHEQNARSIEQAGYQLSSSQLCIEHYGYTGEVMLERDKHARFLRMLTREVEENPNGPFRSFQQFNLGNTYYTMQDYENAVRWFAEADRNPDIGQEYVAVLYTEWASALYFLGRQEEALRVCDRAESLGIAHPGLEFARGHAKLQMKRLDEAESHFLRALEQGQSADGSFVGDQGAFTYKAFYGLALVSAERQRYNETIHYCQRALDIHPGCAEALYLQAKVYRRQGLLSEARQRLEKLLLQAPSDPALIEEMALTLFDQADYASALGYLRKASQNSPDSVELMSRLGECCEKLALWEDAVSLYKNLSAHLPQSAEARVNLGRAFAARGEISHALDCYTDAIHLNPNYANAYFNAADLLYQLGYYPKAAEALLSGLQLDPQNATGFLVLGNCLYHTQDYAAARLAYQAALAQRPDYSEARNNLEVVEQALADNPQAA